MNNISVGKDPYENFPECDKCGKDCTKLAKHYMDIKLPVEIKPEANVEKIQMECCGEPEVVCDNPQSLNTCHLLLVQKVCIKIPIRYTFKHDIGESIVDCCKGIS